MSPIVAILLKDPFSGKERKKRDSLPINDLKPQNCPTQARKLVSFCPRRWPNDCNSARNELKLDSISSPRIKRRLAVGTRPTTRILLTDAESVLVAPLLCLEECFEGHRRWKAHPLVGLFSFHFISFFFLNYTVFFGFLGCLRYDSKRVFAIFEVKWTFQCHLVWVILGLVGIRCCLGWNMYRCLCTLLCLLDRNLVFDKLYSVVVWVASCKQTCPALKYLLKGSYTPRAFFDKKSSTMYVSAKQKKSWWLCNTWPV